MHAAKFIRCCLFVAALVCGDAQVWLPFASGWTPRMSAVAYGSDGIQLNPPELTRGGDVWYNTRMLITDFSFWVQFYAGETTNPPADGICFIVQNGGGTGAEGGLGGGNGFAGIGNSVGLCLDTYSGTSPSYLATQVYTNGNIGQTSAYTLNVPITNGWWWYWSGTYRRSSGVFTWTVYGNGYSQSFSQYIGDIVSIVGDTYATIGFGAATGGLFARHIVWGFQWLPYCSAPSAPSGVVGVYLDALNYRYDCVAGYYGASTTRTASTSTCGWSGSFPSCSACGAGYYCTGGNNRAACPAGYFGSSTTLSSSYCSGLCTAGYQCPYTGTTSSTYQVCGGTGQYYCPAGSTAPTTVTAGYYTTPLTNPVTIRTGQLPCPAYRSCTDGLIDPGVDFGLTCPGGVTTASAPEMTSNSDFGPVLLASTPGYTGAVTWSISTTVNDAGCGAASAVRFNSATGHLATNANKLDYPSCTSGFTVRVTATRANDASLSATCAVSVTISQVGKQPSITDCGPRSVAERSSTNTAVGSALSATVANIGTTLLWSVSSPSVPFTIDGCAGVLRVKTPFSWKTGTSYAVPVTVTNTGISPSLSASCTVTVNVLRVNQLPALVTDAFFVAEMSQAGTVVGQLVGTDADDDVVGNFTLVQADTPDAFNVSRNGTIMVKSAVLDVILKSTYNLAVNFSDGLATVRAPITITLLPVPRPPQTFDQARTILESASPGTQLGPRLNASHPQGTNFTFIALEPTNTFMISSQGMVSLRSGVHLDYNLQSTYSLVFTVMDTNGRTASGILSVTVIEVNKPPRMSGAMANKSMDLQVNEGSGPGTAVGTGIAAYILSVTAVDPNGRDTITYRITSVTPPQAASLFVLEALSGNFYVGASVPGGSVVYEPSWTWPRPQTVMINVSAEDSGSPRMWDNGTVYIRIANIRPRLSGRQVFILANATAGTAVDTATAWTPYTNGISAYSIVSNDQDTQGRNAFTIAASTGIIRLATFAGGQGPAFNYNVKSKFNITVMVTDVNGLTANATWIIWLNHVNRPPVFGTIPRYFAAALTSGSVGTPLSRYVSDPDLDLAIGESFTFAIAGGNTDGTFGISPTDGQVYVANNDTTAFQYPAGAPAPPTFTLTVTATDAGIDGPRFVASSPLVIELTRNLIPPTIGYYNLTVNEHARVGSLVGIVAGSTRNVGFKLNYTLVGAGANAYAPFPFNVSTVQDGGFNVGHIRVTDAASIEYWTGFRRYTATLTVMDDNPLTPLSSSTNIDIFVQWVHEPPFFNARTRAPNSTTIYLSVREHAVSGTNVTADSQRGDGAMVQAMSKDPWQQPLLQYAWAAPTSSAARLFALDRSTGGVTVASTAGDLLYNTASEYSLLACVRDALAAVDCATVLIRIEDVNDPAVFTGMFDLLGNNVTASGLSVREDAAVGTIIGYVRAVDVDRRADWGTVVYGVKSTPDARFFLINSTNGAVYISTPGIDYWDQTRFVVTAGVQDGVANPAESLVVYYDFVVNIIQVNTVQISGFFVGASTPASDGENVTDGGSNSLSLLYTTRSPVEVFVTGRGFGRTARRLQAEGLDERVTLVTASYGLYNATDCKVVVPNTVISCRTVPGVGLGHVWRITVDGWPAVSQRTTGYFAPRITAVTMVGATDTSAAANALNTRGTDAIFVDCLDCGPSSESVRPRLTYGRYPNEYRSPSCDWVVSQSRLSCRTLPGIGNKLIWQLSVGSQLSAAFVDTVVAYAAPVIAGISAPLLDTAGGQVDAMTLTGDMFGPANTTEIVLQYSMDIVGRSQPVYTATNCYTDAAMAHTRIYCTSVPGIGTGLRAVVTVGGLNSSVSPTAIAYRPPLISDITGLGADNADTLGGQQVILSGAQFGPVTPTDEAGVPVGPTAPIARYGSVVRGLPYVASSCRVTVAHRQIICLTVEGTGKDLVWQVTVGAQNSSVYYNRTTSYHPPVVAAYTGEGSFNARTSGNQLVLIEGTNFGPAGTPIQIATYGKRGDEFQAGNCTLLRPHDRIQCSTDVGAGAGLAWFITIDGQRSVAPSTSYGPPEIHDFAGSGALDASTDGGDPVTITGAFFSVQRFLERVTYGATGREYTARDCVVSVNHTQITCYTVPGTGRRLYWLVTVGGQTSALSSRTTSYAAPRIAVISPPSAVTNGGARITISGSNFATDYLAAQAFIKINALGSQPPSQSAVAEHFSAVYAGDVGDSDVSKWLSELPTFRPVTKTNVARGVHNLTFTLPEGFGRDVEVIVVVDSVPSNIARFTYSAPVITNIAPDRQRVALGYLRVFIDGISFCNGQLNCGVVTIDNKTYTADAWGHNQVMVVVPDPPITAPPMEARIVVAGVSSNVRYFKKPVPNIDSLVGQGNWVDMDTRGGQLFWVAGVLDIGLEPVNITIGGRVCANLTRAVDNGRAETDPLASFTLRCTTPEGVGLSNLIIIQTLGGASKNDGSFTFGYAPPSMRDMSLQQASTSAAFRRQLMLANGIATLGGNVTIAGLNLGTPALSPAIVSLDDATEALVLFQDHTRLEVAIPPGAGTNHYLRVTVGGQTSDRLYFSYTPPSITGIAPSHGSTVGGTLVSITGSNFGTVQPWIRIGGSNCTVQEPFAASPGHDMVRCRTSAGQGLDHGVEIIVAGQSSAWFTATPRVAFHYDPPQVFAITPSGGPTSGRVLGPLLSDGLHRARGERIVMTLLGQDLGTNGTIEMRPTAGTETGAVIVPVPRSDVLYHNDTMMQFLMPSGFGDLLRVVAVISGQESAESVAFRYDPPHVVALGYYGKQLSECAPRQRCFQYGNRTRCKLEPADCWPTGGGSPLEIIGESFGNPTAMPAATVITIGGNRCDMVTSAGQDDNTLVCSVPRGLGDRNPVVVRVGTRASEISNSSWFAYDAPIVMSAIPNTPDALGSQVTFRGKNFGWQATPLGVNVSGLPCMDAEWLNDQTVRCRLQNDTVGAKNVSILVAVRAEPTSFFDFEEFMVTECKPGFTGLQGEACLPCAVGAQCPGGERYFDLVTALPGFWRENLTVPDARCEPLRLGRVTSGCPYYSACEPAWSCLGNNLCAEGYEGPRCMFCLRGKYYRANGECIKCPDSPAAVFVGAALVLCAMAALGYWLNKKSVSIALIAIGVDYFQVVSMFARTRIQWPPIVKQMFQIMSAFNLNIEIVAPECMMPNVAFWQKWLFIEGLPLALFALFVLVHGLKTVYKAACTAKGKNKAMWSHLPTLVSTFIVIFRVLYLYITRTTLDVFNCSSTEPPDGKQYMAGMLDVVCWESGSVQLFLLPFAIGTLIFYTVGLPAAALWFLRLKRDAVKYDQILRAKGLGNDRLTNPRFYMFRKMWSKLYYHYKPGKWYWELVITCRKALIAFTSLMFRNSPSYQLSIALLILFAAYVLHMRHLPYLTHADRPKVIAEHLSKAFTDPLHGRIEEDMRVVFEKNFRKGYKNVRTFDATRVTRNPFDAAALALFDYNTVEAVLLASAVLVVLAGIMFDSSRFSSANLAQSRGEYDGLTAAVMLLIAATIAYYVCTFVTDLVVVLFPDTALKMCVCGKKFDSLRGSAHKQSLASRGRANGKVAGVAHPGITAANTDMPSNTSASGTVEMMVNPFVLQSAERSAQRAGDEDAFRAPFSSDVLMSMGRAPDEHVWQRLRDSYISLMGLVDKLQGEVRSLRRDRESGAPELGGAVFDRSELRRKQEFGAMMTRDFSTTGGSERTSVLPPTVTMTPLLHASAASAFAPRSLAARPLAAGRSGLSLRDLRAGTTAGRTRTTAGAEPDAANEQSVRESNDTTAQMQDEKEQGSRRSLLPSAASGTV